MKNLEVKLVYSPKSNEVRMYKLRDGDVVTIKNSLTIEHSSGEFYEVEDGGRDEFMQTIWKRTGRIFTIDELNNYVRESDGSEKI